MAIIKHTFVGMLALCVVVLCGRSEDVHVPSSRLLSSSAAVLVSATSPAVLNLSDSTNVPYILTIAVTNKSQMPIDYYTVPVPTQTNEMIAFSMSISNVVTHAITNSATPSLDTFLGGEIHGTTPDGSEFVARNERSADGSLAALQSRQFSADIGEMLRGMLSTGSYSVVTDVWFGKNSKATCPPYQIVVQETTP